MAFIEKNSEYFRIKNVLLKSGEYSKETDGGLTKAGDGKTYYNDLPYSNVSGEYDASGALIPKTVNPLQDETISGVANTTTVELDVTSEVLTAEVVDNSNIQKVEVVKNSGAVVGTRKQLNFIEGTNITLTITDDNGNDQVDIEIDATGGGSSETVVCTTSENIAAGSIVNLYLNGGVLTARKADATTTGKEADGFVIATTLSGANATVYFSSNTNTAASGLTIGGEYYLDTTAGGVVLAASSPTGAGNVNQYVGKALSATSLVFERGEAVEMA